MRRTIDFMGFMGLFAAAALALGGCKSTVTGGGENSASQLSLVEGADADSCTSGVIGDGVACTPYDEIKIGSSDACAADGLVLVDLSLAADCGGGVTQATYTCCASYPAEPGPDPNSCGSEVIGDGVTCLSPEEWKMQLAGGDTGVDVCAADGRYLHDFHPHYDCADGGSSYVKITCCPSPPAPDPGPVTCDGGALGDGTTCKTAEAWTAEVDAICAPQGYTKLDIGFANDCPDGSSSYAKFYCCAP